MSDENLDQHLEQTFENEGAPPATSEDVLPPKPEILELFDEIKLHPENFTDTMVLDKIFEISRRDVQAAFDASLQETMQLKLNLVNVAFSTIMKIILHRHGMVMLTPEQVEQMKKTQQSNGPGAPQGMITLK